MDSDSATSLRSWWISTLAQSAQELVESRISQLGALPPYQRVRGPEIGLVTVQGRAGGTGQRFVLGEVTITRCVVSMQNPEGQEVLGFGYVQGRRQRQAEMAAICDGLLQLPQWDERVMATVIEPLFQAIEQRRQQQWQTTAATKVEFFTLVREHS